MMLDVRCVTCGKYNTNPSYNECIECRGDFLIPVKKKLKSIEDKNTECIKCKVSKKIRAIGLCHICYGSQYRNNNRENTRQYRRNFTGKNPDYNLKKLKLWRKDNAKKYKRQTDEYNKNNRNRYLRWRKDNPEKIQNYNIKWKKKLSRKMFNVGYMYCLICGRKGRLRIVYSLIRATQRVYSSGGAYFEHRISVKGKWIYDGICHWKRIPITELKLILKREKNLGMVWK